MSGNSRRSMTVSMPARKKIFYGWVILATTFLVMAVTGGGVYYAFGVFLKPMIDELAVSRGAGSVAFSISSICMAVSSPLIGVLVVRFGPRKVMVVGNVGLILSLMLMSQINQLWQLYLVFGILVGMSQSFSSFMPSMVIVNNWFVKRRALAMGITSCGVGVGTFVLAPLIRYLIEVVGWRMAWVFLGGVATFFSLIPVLLFVRTKPEDMGQHPDGDQIVLEEKPALNSGRKADHTPIDWETKMALRTPALWLVAVFSFASLFTLNMISTHQVAHLEDIGMPPLIAAGALGLLAIVSAGGRLLGGALGDRFELRYVAAVVCVLQVAGLIIFINAKDLSLLYAYVIIYGPAYGAALVLTPAIVGAYFGRKNFPAIHGISSGLYQVIAATSPIIAGYIFDSVGSYRIPIIIATVFSAIGGVCVLIAKPPAPPTPIVTSVHSLTNNDIIDHGSRTTGIVITKDTFSGLDDDNYVVKYSFTPNSTDVLINEYTISSTNRGKTVIGEPIEIAFSPSDPHNNLPVTHGKAYVDAIIMWVMGFPAFSLVGFLLFRSIFRRLDTHIM
jgi:MFS family permease